MNNYNECNVEQNNFNRYFLTRLTTFMFFYIFCILHVKEKNDNNSNDNDNGNHIEDIDD